MNWKFVENIDYVLCIENCLEITNYMMLNSVTLLSFWSSGVTPVLIQEGPMFVSQRSPIIRYALYAI